jgi:beta-lactamase class A
VKRRAFVASTVAAAALPPTARAAAALPRTARALPIGVHDILAGIPGITGIYARTLADESPLVSVRAGETFASASVIKLAIMVTAYRAFDAGWASPEDRVTIRASDLIGGSPTLISAAPGDRYRMRELVAAMIQQSDNSASNALITTFGFAAINGVIRSCGMTGTRLGRHFADYVPAGYVSLNVTTPRDIGTLLYGIEHGSRESIDTVAKATSCRAMINLLLGQEDKSKIPSGLPSGTPCANKTGEIDGVRNDAAIVDPFGDKPFVLVVLTRALDDTDAGVRGIAAIARRVNAVVRTSAGVAE